MINFSKSTRKKLKELKDIAYACELDQHLLKLSKKFDDWKNKKINGFDLSDYIHDFHNGISHDLYNTYTTNSVDDVYMIARAVSQNLLKIEDIPEEAIAIVESCRQNLFDKN